MLKVNRGDILLVNFEPVRGSEQGRVRPAVVIQNNILNRYSPLTIVAPLTSKIYDIEYLTNVSILKGDSCLDKDSTILLNQIRTIDKRRIIKKLGFLDAYFIDKVDAALKISLGL